MSRSTAEWTLLLETQRPPDSELVRIFRLLPRGDRFALASALFDFPGMRRDPPVLLPYPSTRNGPAIQRRRQMLQSVFQPPLREPFVLALCPLILEYLGPSEVATLWTENHLRVHRFTMRHQYCTGCRVNYTCDKHALGTVVVVDLPPEYDEAAANLLLQCPHMIQFNGMSRIQSIRRLVQLLGPRLRPPSSSGEQTFKRCFWTVWRRMQEGEERDKELLESVPPGQARRKFFST